jgi:hypothetical protein
MYTEYTYVLLLLLLLRLLQDVKARAGRYPLAAYAHASLDMYTEYTYVLLLLLLRLLQDGRGEGEGGHGPAGNLLFGVLPCMPGTVTITTHKVMICLVSCCSAGCQGRRQGRGGSCRQPEVWCAALCWVLSTPHLLSEFQIDFLFFHSAGWQGRRQGRGGARW